MNTEALQLSGALAAELARPALDLTLHQIETELAQLIEFRQERLADTVDRPSEDEIAALDAEIQRYQIAEPAKVAGVAAIFRSWRAKRETAKAEARRLQEIVKHYECMEARLKDYCAAVLERLPEPARGCRKLTGKDGSMLMLKGNGGLAPLDITEGLLPDQYLDVIIRIPLDQWNAAVAWDAPGILDPAELIRTEPSQQRIRESLAQPCPNCGGTGEEKSGVCHCGDSMEGYHDNHSPVEMTRRCEACGGSGKHAIPGARLLERGVHVECR